MKRRFPPYPVWQIMVIVDFIGMALSLAGLFLILRALVYGGGVTALPITMLLIGGVISGRSRNWRHTLSPFCEFIGSRLTTENCPSCGQSVFDHTPASGYSPEIMKQRWPLRFCANCDRDLSKP